MTNGYFPETVHLFTNVPKHHLFIKIHVFFKKTRGRLIPRRKNIVTAICNNFFRALKDFFIDATGS